MRNISQTTPTLENETVWLTQDQMGELFGRERSVITKHIRNVFKEGELEESSARAKFAHTSAMEHCVPTEKIKEQPEELILQALLTVSSRLTGELTAMREN